MTPIHAFISFHKLSIQEQNIMLENVIFQFKKKLCSFWL
jgi:hypothetical protein